MLNQFSRSELLMGKAGVKQLKQKKIAVFGIGGVGGFVVEALARSGVGAFCLIDHDTISLTNLNRQIIATMQTVGKYKTDVMKERILSINPQANFFWQIPILLFSMIAIILWTPLIRFPQNWHWCKQPMKKRFLSSAVWEREINWTPHNLKLRIFIEHQSVRCAE